MLSKCIIYEVLVLKTSTKNNALIDKYNEQGGIFDDELIELLKEAMYLHDMQVTTPGPFY
jgi:hypothetical protein